MPQPDQPPSLNVRKQGGAVIVTVTGSSDIECADQIRGVAAELLTSLGGPLVLDLSQVRSPGADCLGALAALRLRSQARGAGLKLVNPGAELRRLLEESKLLSVFGIYNDLEQALASQADS
ncbi:MAG TPA: STAS domain-containing protein [Phycisphaerae bacterium]|nr:STAS domain-containing protein [Phycisphaerae bacterium]